MLMSHKTKPPRRPGHAKHVQHARGRKASSSVVLVGLAGLIFWGGAGQLSAGSSTQSPATKPANTVVTLSAARPPVHRTLTTRVATPEVAAVRLIHRYFPRTLWVSATKVAKCESTFHANETGHDSNGTEDLGLFQFNTGGTLQEVLGLVGKPTTALHLAYNENLNVQMAVALYRRDGWGPWSCKYVLG
jgi:hypothetical protein